MKAYLKKLLTRETITYLIFGVLTTLTDWVVLWIGRNLLGLDILIANTISFIAAASFAYVTNKLWVFESKSWAPGVLAREIPMFVAARLFSFGLSEAGLWLARDVLGAGDLILWQRGDWKLDGLDLAKILLSVLVVILNYVFSKLVIFRKKK